MKKGELSEIKTHDRKTAILDRSERRPNPNTVDDNGKYIKREKRNYRVKFLQIGI